MRAKIAVTIGDPRGIGPEIIQKALLHPVVRERVDAILVGPSGTGVQVHELTGAWNARGSERDAGRLAGRAVERAAAMALAGEVAGIVTAPLDKHALHLGGFEDAGHTELLSRVTGSPTAMMLASRTSPGGHPLRVVLVTTHIPLSDVTRSLTREAIARTARITRTGLQEWYGIPAPRLALCALNPHAGDGGRFGHEDDTVLGPAAREHELSGPIPADTVFVRAMRGEFDAVIAPYHDVGMTAIKVAAFGHAVNVTLGLPFPRTSPDHGTALDIAGKGVADPSSMIEAMLVCSEIVARIEQGRLIADC